MQLEPFTVLFAIFFCHSKIIQPPVKFRILQKFYQHQKYFGWYTVVFWISFKKDKNHEGFRLNEVSHVIM